MTAIRGFLIALGVGIALWGLHVLLGLGRDNLIATLTWLVGGVFLHDGVLAPATIVVFFAITRVVRGPLPLPVIIGGLVLGTVTLLASPTILRLGRIKDNSSLVDRNYTVGWLVFAGLTLLIVTAATLLGHRRSKGGARGASTGRR
ncbi:MAG TPA: hypothetical protein VHZ06_05935 [Marmoricola sp.]|jgi:hypothetical protein|nr:hypothetical protein [Marmoricola sp.]